MFLLDLRHDLWRIETELFGKLNCVDGREGDVAVIRATFCGTISQGEHDLESASDASEHVCDRKRGKYAGSFFEAVGFAVNVTKSGGCVGYLLIARTL